MTLTLSDLPAGHSFEPIVFNMDAETTRAYCASVGDANALYEAEGVVPPLAVAAVSLGGLLNQVGLPPGSLHVSESLEASAAVPVDARIECTAKLVQRSVRNGMVVTVLESLMNLNGVTAVKARATVMSPVPSS